MVVTIGTSGLVQLCVQGARRAGGETGNAFELLLRGLEKALGRAEVSQDRPPSRGTDARQGVEDRLERLRVPAAPVVAEREAVRLVADPLQELKAGVVLVEHDGRRLHPGTNTSSSRFASATTATRGRSYVEWIASRAAES